MYPQQSSHVTIPHTVWITNGAVTARRCEVDCLHIIAQVSLIFANVGVHDVLIQAELDALEAAHPGRFKAGLPSCCFQTNANTDVQPIPEGAVAQSLLSGVVESSLKHLILQVLLCAPCRSPCCQVMPSLRSEKCITSAPAYRCSFSYP